MTNRINIEFDIDFDERIKSSSLINKFFPLSNLLFRLLNDFIIDRKIKTIAFFFYSDFFYSVIDKERNFNFRNHYVYTKKSIVCYDLLDWDVFNNKSFEEQEKYIWERCYMLLSKIAKE